MVAVVEVGEFGKRFVVGQSQCHGESFRVGLHGGGEFRLADAADGGILVEHAYVFKVVKLAEYAYLREFRDAGDERKLKVWVEHLQRTVEVLHYSAQRAKVLLFVNHIKQGRIVLVDDDDNLLARLLKRRLHKTCKAHVGVGRLRGASVGVLVFGENQSRYLSRRSPSKCLAPLMSKCSTGCFTQSFS